MLLPGEESAWEAATPEPRLLDGLVLPGHRLPAARAELLVRAGRRDEALAAYGLAIERCDDEAEHAHLEERRLSSRGA